MKHRGPDRRGHPRFEIVGTFLGSLEIWHRRELRNLGRGGALVKTAESYQQGNRIQARLTVQRHRRDFWARVSHVSALAGGESGYLVGLDFQQTLDAIDLPAAQPERDESSIPAERRRWPRVVENPEGVDFDMCEWMTVQLHDVSMSGTMFTAKSALDPGARGRFRTRFGEKQFEAALEVKRRVPSAGSAEVYGVGASFTGMDTDSRRALAGFLFTSIN